MKQKILSLLAMLLLLQGFAQNFQEEDGTDYSNELYISKIAPDGKWIMYKEIFPFKSIAFLRNLETGRLDTIPDNYNQKFSNDSKWFANISSEGKLHLFSLNEGEKEIVQNVTSFSFSNNSEYIAYLQKIEEEESYILNIRNLKNKKIWTFKNCMSFAWNPVENLIFFAVKDGHNIQFNLLFPNRKKTIVPSPILGENIVNAQWSQSGKYLLALIEQDNTHSLLRMDNKGEQKILQNSNTASEGIISSRKPYIAENGEKILFHIQPTKNEKDATPKVEVWNSYDPALYPLLKHFEESAQSSRLFSWFPEKNNIQEISTNEHPQVATDINHQYALLYNRLEYGHQFKEFPDVNVYTKNIETGETYLVETKLPTEYFGIGISPKGNYITFFKNSNWYCHNIRSKKTINLTKNIDGVFISDENQYPRKEVFDWPAWTESDDYVILTDKHDLWLFKPDGSEARRLTKGRESNLSFSISKKEFIDDFHRLTYSGGRITKITNPNAFVAKVTDSKNFKTGLALVGVNKETEVLFLKNEMVSKQFLIPNRNKIIYLTENLNNPPAIYCFNLETGENVLIHQSNQSLLDNFYVKHEIIKYKVEGEELNALLVYPYQYEQTKKYPMISYIYEKQANYINKFNPPSDYTFTGFSILNYAQNGYFVLLPDFKYEIGNPGKSALKSILAAVDKALENKTIDQNKLGLIGHSFGGYEAAFIATQTNRFAAIAAGAAVTNLTSHYHGVNWNHNNTDMWRYEDQQWRMGVSYYKNKENYLKNSPLEYVENLQTPLLLWTGKLDFQITWTQSLEMFLAMTRLSKKGKLLLFPDEGHGFFSPYNQKLLSNHLKAWFDKNLNNTSFNGS